MYLSNLSRTIIMMVLGIYLPISAAQADQDLTITTKNIEANPFTIVETTYSGEVALEENNCQQKIQKQNAQQNYTMICKCKFSLTFPQFVSTQYEKSALDKVNQVLKSRAEKLKNEYQTTLTDCSPSVAGNEFQFNYGLEYKNKFDKNVQLNHNPQVLSIRYTYNYCCGAHPVYSNNFLNFDLTNGKLLTFEDVIDKDSLGKAYDVVWQSLKNNNNSFYYKFAADSYEQAKTKLKQDAIFKVQEFYFTGNGLMVYFNPVDVGPWVSGRFEIPIMSKYVNPKYLAP